MIRVVTFTMEGIELEVAFDVMGRGREVYRARPLDARTPKKLKTSATSFSSDNSKRFRKALARAGMDFPAEQNQTRVRYADSDRNLQKGFGGFPD